MYIYIYKTCNVFANYNIFTLSILKKSNRVILIQAKAKKLIGLPGGILPEPDRQGVPEPHHIHH